MATKVMKPVTRPGQVAGPRPATVQPPAGRKITPPVKPQAQAGAAPAPVVVKKPGGVGPQTLVVFSKAQQDIGLQTLMGEYAESGKNHGRSYFKRKPQSEADQEVFLYFWDMRDGAEFSGWWFGDKVGGVKVWSRCEKSDQLPPQAGWRVPWDGDVQPDLVCEVKPTQAPGQAQPPAGLAAKEEASAPKAKEELGDAAAVALSGELDERVQRATDRVVLAEIEATQALESVNAMLEGEVTEDNLKVVEELLQAQIAAMTDAHKTLAADIMDARKTAPKTVPMLTNLTPRVRSVQASLAQESKKAKELVGLKKQEQEELKLRAKAQEAQAKAEQRDAKALEEALPEAMEVVTGAEDTLDAVLAAASPLAVDYADEMTEASLAAIKETEAAVVKSQESIKAAYAKITLNIKLAKDYAPEAKKVAFTEYTALQEKLNEAKKKLAPYEKVRKAHETKLESKKMMTEVTQKMGAVEVEVEKVTSLLVGTSPSEEGIRAAETALPPVSMSLASIMKLLEQRLQDAALSLKEELLQMQERGLAAKEKLDTFRTELRTLREQLEVQLMLRQGLEKTQAAEEVLTQTAEAEAPFLKGVELPPGPEATAAIEGLKAVGQAAEAKVHMAANYLKAKAADVGRFPEASRASISDELAQLQSRVEVVAQKLAAFKREASARETAILMTEVSAKVKDAEAKVQRTVAASAPLAADKLEELGVAKLKEAAEQTMEAEKMAAVACAEARKLLQLKQREGQAKESPGYAAELVKFQGRLTAAQQELARQRKVAVQGEKLWKSTLVLQTKEDQMKHVEAEVEKAELLTTPLGDERPSNESILEMDKSVNTVQETLTEMVASLEETQQTAQGSLKAQLVGLLGRAKKSQTRIDEMKAATREQRERVQCQVMLQQARAKLDAVDVSFMQVAEAEVPYLKGIEILPLEESTKAVADSEAAATAVQKALNEAKGFLATKMVEMKSFVESVAAKGTQDAEALVQRQNEAKEKLVQFVKETEGRKKIALEQQAVAKVSEAEEAVQKTILAGASLAAPGTEETSQDAAQEIVEKLGEAEQEAQEKLEEARKFLLERQRDRKARLEPETLTKLVGRLEGVRVELAKAKSAASEHEQKFVARLLLQEAKDMLKAFEAEVEKTTEAAAPLTVEGGKSFVIASNTKQLLDALSEYSQKGELSRKQLFGKITPSAASAGRVSEADFVAFLDKVPELCSRPDLAFNSEQRQAVFQHLDGDKDGFVSETDFVDMFHERFICTHEVAVSDGFDPAQSKTTDTLQVDDVVEALGEPKSLDAMGLIRVEVRVLKDQSTGWVTLQSTQGAAYLSPYTAYTSFIKKLDRTIASTQATSAKTSAFITTKSTELRECQQGPLADAKAELATIRPKVNQARSKLEQLQKKVEEGKRQHSKREEMERRTQEEKKERKAASLLLSAVGAKVEKAQAALKALEDAASPFTSVPESELSSIKTPLTLQKQAAAAAASVTTEVAEAKESLKANEGRLVQAARGPWYEARQELIGKRRSVEQLELKGKATLDAVQAACTKLTEAKFGEVSAALRKSVQDGKQTGEALFAKLAGKGKEKIPEAALSKHLDTLKDVKLSAEHKQMIFQKSGPDGVTRRGFFAMLERYFRCTKEIAVTTAFDIKSGTTIRKLDAEEFVEVLSGPQIDDSSKLMRIEARALSDGTKGWITIKGNAGTPFLVESIKPCYVAAEPLSMQDAFATEGCKEVRKVKRGEVLEVLEGPKKEVLGNALRAKGKAAKDGSVGWFTLRSKTGESMAEQGKSTYVCKQSVALTDAANIKDCTVLRKLDRGEALIVLDGPQEDTEAGVHRIRAKATKDDKEGWVTIKGNAGTSYVEESGKTYIVTSSMPLQTKFQTEASTNVRMLEEQETVELLDAPREEKSDAPVRVNVRAVTDGTTGWLSLRKNTMKRWSPAYSVKQQVDLTDGQSAEKSKTLRALEPREALELLEGPKEDASSGCLRLRARVVSDGTVGWVTLINTEGQPLLENVAA